ncbi:TnsA-like heteromeric transposase endonuclease subunit [Nonomuraea basaltis]|nr:TnsA-like heteromeric transposase endonuclease subunit [Nonomuraea basaltis]
MGRSTTAAVAVLKSLFEITVAGDRRERTRGPLSSLWDMPFEQVEPARSFPSFKGQKNFTGLWWSASTGTHVGYESWVERDVAMMLDFRPDVVAFSSQPFWLHWPGEKRERRHAPDFFARLSDGSGLVVDVRPDDRIRPEDAESFEATARACAEVGWRYQRTGGPSPVVRANVRWLSGYRHSRCFHASIAEALVGVFRDGRPLFAGAEAVGDRLAVLPVLFHLMWRQELVADLDAAVLSPGTMVRVAKGVR